MIDLKLLESISEEQISAFQTYAEEHQVFDLFQDIIRQLAIHQPKDPILWMANHLDKKQVPSIVIIAPPTANESKLCEELAKAINAEYISTRQLLQAAIEKKSNLGLQAMPYFTKGQWVPDRVVMDVIALKLGHADVQRAGYVLQGFPKTRAQMQLMQKRGWLPHHWFHLELPDSFLVHREASLYRETHPTTTPEEEAAYMNDVKARLHTYRFHLQQMLPGSHWVPIQVPYTASAQKQLKAVALALHQRRPYRAPHVHRVYLIGGTPEQRHAIASMMESQYHMVYLCPRRLFVDTPDIDPTHLPKSQLLDQLKHAVLSRACKTAGYVVNFAWTPTLVEATASLPAPNRVLYLPQASDPEDLYLTLVRRFQRCEHPFFYASPAKGTLQVLPPGGQGVEQVRQALLRPVPYWSEFCDLDKE